MTRVEGKNSGSDNKDEAVEGSENDGKEDDDDDDDDDIIIEVGGG